jgi:hypothetical protein
LSYCQDKKDSNYFEKHITFKPTEVYSSGILNFNFEESKNLIYRITKNNEVISSFNVKKDEGLYTKKIDLSFLENGQYNLKIFIDDIEVKQVDFIKN